MLILILPWPAGAAIPSPIPSPIPRLALRLRPSPGRPERRNTLAMACQLTIMGRAANLKNDGNGIGPQSGFEFFGPETLAGICFSSCSDCAAVTSREWTRSAWSPSQSSGDSDDLRAASRQTAQDQLLSTPAASGLESVAKPSHGSGSTR